MPGGQPTKYRPEYCEMLVKHLTAGFSFVSFGGVAGVCEDTLYEWVKVHPKFSEAKKIGWTAYLHEWEKIGVKGIKGEIDKFSASTWIFNMKARFRWSDSGTNQEQESDEMYPDVE